MELVDRTDPLASLFYLQGIDTGDIPRVWRWEYYNTKWSVFESWVYINLLIHYSDMVTWTLVTPTTTCYHQPPWGIICSWDLEWRLGGGHKSAVLCESSIRLATIRELIILIQANVYPHKFEILTLPTYYVHSGCQVGNWRGSYTSPYGTWFDRGCKCVRMYHFISAKVKEMHIRSSSIAQMIANVDDQAFQALLPPIP